MVRLVRALLPLFVCGGRRLLDFSAAFRFLHLMLFNAFNSMTTFALARR